MTDNDGRLFYPSASRNQDAISDAIANKFPHNANILEIGSGSGEHAIHFTGLRPDLNWQPSDPSPEARISISAWAAFHHRQNINPPLEIDTTIKNWTNQISKTIDAVLSINMIHIAPFAACRGLFHGANQLLNTSKCLILYGPFSSNGQHTSSSNANFNDSLKSKNKDWGVRDIESDLTPLALEYTFTLTEQISMPTNNQVLVFEKH